MGSEFPIMNYLVFGLYKLFGVDWWQGRLVNLVVSSIGCLFFYKTIFQFIKKEVAFPATLVLLASLWFSHSRKFMPDVFSTSLVLIAIYFGLSFLYKKKNWHLILYFIFILFGLLSKLPAFIITGLLVPVMFEASISLKKKLLFVLVSILALLPVIWWYFYWAPKLTSDFGFFYFFMGSDMYTSLNVLMTEWQAMLKNFYFDAVGYLGFVFYSVGVIYVVIKKERVLFLILIATLVLQLILMIKSGESFIKHSYYMMPFIPVMALFSGYFISVVNVNWVRTILISAVVIESVLNLQHDFMPKTSKHYLLELENVADTYSLKDDLIVINNSSNPRSLYLAHRKGWGVKSTVVSNSDYLKEIVKKGCELFIWDRHAAELPEHIPYFKFVSKTDDFGVYIPDDLDK